MNTSYSGGFKNKFKIMFLERLKKRVYFEIGRLATRGLDYYQSVMRDSLTCNAGPLPQEEIDRITQFQADRLASDKMFQKRMRFRIVEDIRNKPFAQLNPQDVAAKLVSEVIDNNYNKINVVMNIGARIDFVTDYLSKRYKDKKFISVDFQKNIRNLNEGLIEGDNWSFVSGYGLNVIKEIDSVDLVFMTSTSVLFGSKELDAYIAALAEKAKFVVLNEPWVPNPSWRMLGRVTLPEDVPEDQPLLTGRRFYGHNYPARFERHGFTLNFSEIGVAKDIEDIMFYRMVAVNNNIK